MLDQAATEMRATTASAGSDGAGGSVEVSVLARLCGHALLLLHCLAIAAMDHQMEPRGLQQAAAAAARALLLPNRKPQQPGIGLTAEAQMHAVCTAHASNAVHERTHTRAQHLQRRQLSDFDSGDQGVRVCCEHGGRWR